MKIELTELQATLICKRLAGVPIHMTKKLMELETLEILQKIKKEAVRGKVNSLLLRG